MEASRIVISAAHSAVEAIRGALRALSPNGPPKHRYREVAAIFDTTADDDVAEHRVNEMVDALLVGLHMDGVPYKFAPLQPVMGSISYVATMPGGPSVRATIRVTKTGQRTLTIDYVVDPPMEP